MVSQERTTNAEALRGAKGIRSQKSQIIDVTSFCLVTMASAQSPSAFLPFIDKTILKTANFQMRPKCTIINIKNQTLLK